MLKATLLFIYTTVSPELSLKVTTGCMENTVPAVADELGWVVNASDATAGVPDLTQVLSCQAQSPLHQLCPLVRGQAAQLFSEWPPQTTLLDSTVAFTVIEPAVAISRIFLLRQLLIVIYFVPQQ